MQLYHAVGFHITSGFMPPVCHFTWNTCTVTINHAESQFRIRFKVWLCTRRSCNFQQFHYSTAFFVCGNWLQNSFLGNNPYLQLANSEFATATFYPGPMWLQTCRMDCGPTLAHCGADCWSTLADHQQTCSLKICVKRCNVVHWFGTRDAEHTYWNSILSLIDKYLHFLYSCICSQYSIQMMHLEI